MGTYQLQTPQCVYAGAGSMEAVREIIAREGSRCIAVITDRGIERTGLLRKLTDILGSTEADYRVFADIPAEPSYGAVQEAANAVSAHACDLIIALGGGSVMDTAKLCSLLHGEKFGVHDLLKNPGMAEKQIRTAMIPTTCGTGSEATCNAIVSVPEEEIKVGIVNKAMIPDAVILDAETIRRLPPPLIAATGIDALAHAVECYTSKKATPLSDTYAMASAKLIFRNIERAYDDADDMAAKEAMMLGAYYGGVAIAGSGTTAVHALSYPLGGKYHIPHGVSNAILFAPVMAFNRDACEERLRALFDGVYGDTEHGLRTAEEKSRWVTEEIARLVKALKIPTSLAQYRITAEDLESLAVAGSGVKRLLDNNMKPAALDDIRRIYQQIL